MATQIRLLALLFLPGFAAAQRFPLKTFTVADGLAHDEVNKIYRDSRGLLWFCTAEGLSRFNGYSFVTFGVEQGLPHPSVNDILETSDGDYWVATDGGLDDDDYFEQWGALECAGCERRDVHEQ